MAPWMSTASESRLRGRAEGAGNDHRTPHSSCDGGRLANDEGTAICMQGPLRSAPAGRPTSVQRGGREEKKADASFKGEFSHQIWGLSHTGAPRLSFKGGAAIIVWERGCCWVHVSRRRWIWESYLARLRQYSKAPSVRCPFLPLVWIRMFEHKARAGATKNLQRSLASDFKCGTWELLAPFPVFPSEVQLPGRVAVLQISLGPKNTSSISCS